MKNFRKLFIAAIMLVVALTAVISSTYAWFTLQNQADVDDMQLNVGSAGLDLQISGTGNPNDFGYSVNLGNPAGTLVPVTYDKSDNKFKYLGLHSSKAYLEYKDATSFGLSGLGDYLAYDLWFKTSSTAGITLYLDTTNSPFTNTTGTPDKAMRIMFAVVGTGNVVDWEHAVIYEPVLGTGTYGTGDYFIESNGWIAFNSFNNGSTDPKDWFLKREPINPSDLDQGYKYVLNDAASGDYMYGRQYDATSPVSNKLTITTLSQNVVKRIRVFIWIEGWDGDANDTMALKALKSYLLFKGE